MLAARKGHAECVRLLLEAGADTEAKNDVRRRSATSAVGRISVWVQGRVVAIMNVGTCSWFFCIYFGSYFLFFIYSTLSRFGATDCVSSFLFFRLIFIDFNSFYLILFGTIMERR
jgi:hypothetical protein